MWIKSAGCGARSQRTPDRCLIIWPNISSYNQAPGPAPPVQMNEWRVGAWVRWTTSGRNATCVRARSGHLQQPCEIGRLENSPNENQSMGLCCDLQKPCVSALTCKHVYCYSCCPYIPLVNTHSGTDHWQSQTQGKIHYRHLQTLYTSTNMWQTLHFMSNLTGRICKYWHR